MADNYNHVIRKGVPLELPTSPRSQGVPVGTEVTLQVQATEDCLFQWAFGEALLQGETGLALAIGPVNRANTGVYSVFVDHPSGLGLRLMATVRALVSPVLLAPRVFDNGSVQLLFQDADGGIPYDLSQVQVQWQANSLIPNEGAWQVLNAKPTLTNDMVEFIHSNATTNSSTYYRVVER